MIACQTAGNVAQQFRYVTTISEQSSARDGVFHAGMV
jgi:hypothetical protein